MSWKLFHKIKVVDMGLILKKTFYGMPRRVFSGIRTRDSLARVLACLVLLSSGLLYRYFAYRFDISLNNKVELPVALRNFPLQIGGWDGEDIELDDSILAAAGNDDYLNRLYLDNNTGEWLGVYVAYTGNPRTMIGHRPERCYTGSGWLLDGSEDRQLVTPGGNRIDFRLHRFHMPMSSLSTRFVANYYILNGRIVSGEKEFSGMGWRMPNVSGHFASYVAQVQFSSDDEDAITRGVMYFADSFIGILPDENGNTNAVESRDSNLDGNEL